VKRVQSCCLTVAYLNKSKFLCVGHVEFGKCIKSKLNEDVLICCSGNCVGFKKIYS
jgi:hypothetical protein